VEAHSGSEAHEAGRSSEPGNCTGGRASSVIRNECFQPLKPDGFANLSCGKEVSPIAPKDDNTILHIQDLLDEGLFIAVLEVAFDSNDAEVFVSAALNLDGCRHDWLPSKNRKQPESKRSKAFRQRACGPLW
jgi:hypothetical protein